MSVKCNTKTNPFCTSSDIFLKDVNFDGHWVVYSVMKIVDGELFQRSISTKEMGKQETLLYESSIKIFSI